MAQTNELLAPDVRALITRQRGILAAAQAAACGLPRETVRMRVSRGLWQRLLPSVYLLQCGPPNPVQRAFAAQVYAGEHSIITGPAALRLHGVGDVVSGLWDDIDGWTTWANSSAAVPSTVTATSRASGTTAAATVDAVDAVDAVSPIALVAPIAPAALVAVAGAATAAGTAAGTAIAAATAASTAPATDVEARSVSGSASSAGSSAPASSTPSAAASATALSAAPTSPLSSPSASAVSAAPTSGLSSVSASVASTPAIRVRGADARANRALASPAAATGSAPRSPNSHNPRRRPDPGPAAGSIYHPIPPLEADFPAWRVHLLVPHGQRRQNIEYVRISRTTRLPEPVGRYGLRLAPPARAALDACSWCLEAPDEVTAEAFVETVVRATVLAGLADLGELEYELEQAPRRHTRPLRDALARARTREHAAATRRLFDGLKRQGPQGLVRHIAIYGERRRIAVAEALWPSRALVVTIDAKPNAVAELTRLGFAVIQISADELARNTAGVVERITSALAARPEARLPRGVALLPIVAGQTEPDAAVEAGLPGRVQLALTSMPMLPQWSGLRVRSPAFSGAF